MNNDVFVFIPTWNGVKLQETLASIPKDVPVEVFNNKEHDWSLAKCWNYAMDKYVDDYKTLIISNDDVEFPEGSVYALAYNLYGLRHQRPGPEAIMVTAYNPDIPNMGDRDMLWIPDRYGLSCSMYCFCVDKRLREKVGYFDEYFYPAYYEDCDMVYRIKLAGYEVYSVVPVKHFEGQTHKTDPERKKLLQDTRPGLQRYYASKWGGWPWWETYTIPFDPDSAEEEPRFKREYRKDYGIEMPPEAFRNLVPVKEQVER